MKSKIRDRSHAVPGRSVGVQGAGATGGDHRRPPGGVRYEVLARIVTNAESGLARPRKEKCNEADR